MLQIQDNPWLGLASYQEKDAELFFGRKKETAFLCDVIRQNYSTVIYGKSGMGKTSLINAGVIPLLAEEGFLPVYIKLEHNADRSYSRQIIEAVTRKLEEQGGELESKADLEAMVSDEYKLWSFFHTHVFWSKDNHRVVPVVFVDQFEEIFTICENKSDASAFFGLLNDLFQLLPPDDVLRMIEENNIRIDFNETASFRLILSLREDFLARLEDYSYDIPVLKKNRVGVSPLTGLQALEVMLNPIPGIMDRQAALKILEKVSKCAHIEDNDEVLSEISVETCILSLFCSQLFKKTIELKKDMITLEIIEKFGDNIINNYYHECMKKLSRDSVTYLEDRLLTSSGYRNSLAYEDVVPKYVLKNEIEHLERCRLVRVEILNKTERIEFTHDVLCGVALEHKTQRRRKSLRNGKVVVGTGHVIEYLLMVAFVLFLFWGVDDPFRDVVMKDRVGSLAVATLLLPVSMLMRLVVYDTDRRSVWFSIMMFLLSNVGGFFACDVLDRIRCPEVLWMPWCMFYFLYTFIIFIVSFTKSRKGSLAKLLKPAFLIGYTNTLALKFLGVFTGVFSLLLAVVSGIYMRAPLTVAMMATIVPVALLVTSVWKKGVFKERKVWMYGLVLWVLSLGIYASQFTHYRILTYACSVLLLAVTYMEVSVLMSRMRVLARCLSALAVWLVCFVMLPVLVMGYNFWNLRGYAFIKDGLVVSLSNKVDNRYVVLQDERGRQGAFDRRLRVLVPARYMYMGSEARYDYGMLEKMKAVDIRFLVNGDDSVFISDCLAYRNKFSKSLLKCYRHIVGIDVNGMIRTEFCSQTKKSDKKSDTEEYYSSDVKNRLDELCSDRLLQMAICPDVYWKMAGYYHAKDSAGKEIDMLVKGLQYAVACDSTARFLAKGNWRNTREDALSSLASAMVYVETGYLYSNYQAQYDSCFLADKPYQQFVKTFMAGSDPQTFLSEVIASGKYDNIIVASTNRILSGISLRNPYFNGYVKDAYGRSGNLVSESYALIFMGEYEEAKRKSLLAMDSLPGYSLLASTNLVTAQVFLGEYGEAYRMLESYRDSIVYNGVYNFYRDCVLQDVDIFERTGIINDIPDEEYRKLRNFLDPQGDRTHSMLAKSGQYGVYWAVTGPDVHAWWWSPFGLGRKGTLCLLDEQGNRITPEFDDVYIPHGKIHDYGEWTYDSVVIYNLNGKRGYYDVAARRFITGAEFSHAWIFSEGLAAVAKYDKEEYCTLVGFINEEGKVVIPFQYKYVKGHDYVFEDGFVFMPDRWGAGGEVINKAGEVVDIWYE